MSLEEATARRRSIRHLTSVPLAQFELSQLLWAAQGVTGASLTLRSVPSAGATHPLEIFVVCGLNSVEGVGEGVYRYVVGSHAIALHHAGDVRLELAEAALGERYVYRAPLSIVICAVYERTTQRYGGRGERYVHIEVGHAGQNIYLQATALGLATVAIGAFYDEEVREVLRLEQECEPLYIMPVGKPA